MVLCSSHSLANRFVSSSFSGNSCTKRWTCSRSPRSSLFNPLGFLSHLCSNTSIFSLTHPAFFIYLPKSLARYTHSPVITSTPWNPSSTIVPFCPELVTREVQPLEYIDTNYHVYILTSQQSPKSLQAEKRACITLPEASQLHLARSLEFRNSDTCSKQFLVSL